MSEAFDPGQLASGIAALDEQTGGLDPSGGYNGPVGDTTPSTGSFTFVAGSVSGSETASGTDSASAFQLSCAINFVGGGGSDSGVILPDLSGQPGADVIIFNTSASVKTIYPATEDQSIDGNTAGDGVPLTNAKRCVYIMGADGLSWTSAQLGVVSA